jgi:hypothetical protein
LAAWAKWRAVRGVDLLLYGMCTYTRPRFSGTKTGAGLLREDHAQ